MLDAIREYNWKWLLEIFYGVGVAVVLAVALFVVENNPFDQSPDNFDTFAEWRTWALVVWGVGFRAMWVGASSIVAKIMKLLIESLAATP